jgi:hypothetical protein
MAPDKLQTRLRIKSALGERSARVACLIADSIRNALDLLDEQSDVIEAMLEHVKDAERKGIGREQRHDLRLAILRYMEDHALKEARARERLFQGITGLQEPDHA